MSFSASFLSLACPTKRITRKEKMLSEMNEIVPWRDLENIITPYWMDPVVGRKRTALSLLLRMYFLQQWYNLSDE
jgi:IS5 family transposase